MIVGPHLNSSIDRAPRSTIRLSISTPRVSRASFIRRTHFDHLLTNLSRGIFVEIRNLRGNYGDFMIVEKFVKAC